MEFKSILECMGIGMTEKKRLQLMRMMLGGRDPVFILSRKYHNREKVQYNVADRMLSIPIVMYLPIFLLFIPQRIFSLNIPWGVWLTFYCIGVVLACTYLFVDTQQRKSELEAYFDARFTEKTKEKMNRQMKKDNAVLIRVSVADTMILIIMQYTIFILESDFKWIPVCIAAAAISIMHFLVFAKIYGELKSLQHGGIKHGYSFKSNEIMQLHLFNGTTVHLATNQLIKAGVTIKLDGSFVLNGIYGSKNSNGSVICIETQDKSIIKLNARALLNAGVSLECHGNIVIRSENDHNANLYYVGSEIEFIQFVGRKFRYNLEELDYVLYEDKLSKEQGGI